MEFECEILVLPTRETVSEHQADLEANVDTVHQTKLDIDPKARRAAELWGALADAVLSDRVFDEIEFERSRQTRLAEVFELADYRNKQRPSAAI